MINTKKILTGLVLSGILSSGLYANCGMQKHKGMSDRDNSSCQMSNKHNKKMMKKSHHKNSIMKMIRQLDLTKEQRISIKQIMKESREKRTSISEAFSKTSFDKTKFISMMKEKKENKLEARANMIEKVYGILNPVQKEYLKVLLEKKQNNKEKRHNNKG